MDTDRMARGLIEHYEEKRQQKEAEEKKAAETFFGRIKAGIVRNSTVLTAIGDVMDGMERRREDDELAQQLNSIPEDVPSDIAPLRGIDFSAEERVDESAFGLRLVQAMIAAAHADGTLDSEERQRIMTEMKALSLNEEEEYFLLAEMDAPRPAAEIAQGIDDPRQKQALYLMALAAIVRDTLEEANFLIELGRRLGFDRDARRKLNTIAEGR